MQHHHPSSPISYRRPEARRAQARQAAVAFVERQRLAHRTTRDGRHVGIQATLATGAAADGLDLYAVLDGMVGHASTDEDQLFAGDPARELWQTVGKMVERKLGFPLEPELFSNMLGLQAMRPHADDGRRLAVGAHVGRRRLPLAGITMRFASSLEEVFPDSVSKTGS